MEIRYTVHVQCTVSHCVNCLNGAVQLFEVTDLRRDSISLVSSNGTASIVIQMF